MAKFYYDETYQNFFIRAMGIFHFTEKHVKISKSQPFPVNFCGVTVEIILIILISYP